MASSVQSNRPSTPNYCGYWRTCNMWCWKAFQWLPVLLIVSIVTWSYYAYVYQLCFSTIKSALQQWVYLVIYHVLLIMFAWSYWRTMFANIEQIPSKYFLTGAELEKLLSVDTEEEQRTIIENFAKDLPIVTRTMSGSIRYCNRCLLVKPDRAHHCSICSRCVLKMDHHCPWVKNCVCFQNYKFFLLFLGYALLYCLFIMSTCLQYFIKFWMGEMATSGSPGRYHIVFAFFVALMFAISLGSLFGYHCYLVAHNRTTLEAFRAPMFRGGADKNGFSLGAFNNFKEVFGKRPNLWLLPVYTSFGDGIVFPLPKEDEDTESLLSSDRWDRWGERARPFDEADGSSIEEI